MTQEITIDELWALAKEHARSIHRDRKNYLPTIDEDKKMWTKNENGARKKEVFFHIDNDPAVHITDGSIEDLVYIDCKGLEEWDGFEGVSESDVIQQKEELRDRIQQTF